MYVVGPAIFDFLKQYGCAVAYCYQHTNQFEEVPILRALSVFEKKLSQTWKNKAYPHVLSCAVLWEQKKNRWLLFFKKWFCPRKIFKSFCLLISAHDSTTFLVEKIGDGGPNFIHVLINLKQWKIIWENLTRILRFDIEYYKDSI